MECELIRSNKADEKLSAGGYLIIYKKKSRNG